MNLYFKYRLRMVYPRDAVFKLGIDAKISNSAIHTINSCVPTIKTVQHVSTEFKVYIFNCKCKIDFIKNFISFFF